MLQGRATDGVRGEPARPTAAGSPTCPRRPGCSWSPSSAPTGPPGQRKNRPAITPDDVLQESRPKIRSEMCDTEALVGMLALKWLRQQGRHPGSVFSFSLTSGSRSESTTRSAPHSAAVVPVPGAISCHTADTPSDLTPSHRKGRGGGDGRSAEWHHHPLGWWCRRARARCRARAPLCLRPSAAAAPAASRGRAR